MLQNQLYNSLKPSDKTKRIKLSLKKYLFSFFSFYSKRKTKQILSFKTTFICILISNLKSPLFSNCHWLLSLHKFLKIKKIFNQERKLKLCSKKNPLFLSIDRNENYSLLMMKVQSFTYFQKFFF